MGLLKNHSTSPANCTWLALVHLQRSMFDEVTQLLQIKYFNFVQLAIKYSQNHIYLMPQPLHLYRERPPSSAMLTVHAI